MNAITSFRDENYFLSNMFPCTISFEGLTYPSAESAFQAAKCLDPNDRIPFTKLNGYAAKKLGRKVALRADWETVKQDIMYQILKAKFSQQEFKTQLLHTGNAELIEGNTWNDTFWGVNVRTGKGRNHLGKLLMRVRTEFASNDRPTIVVLGGSFNPPTLAHEQLLLETIKKTHADFGIFVPSSEAYVTRKMNKTASRFCYSEAQRKAMLDLICEDQPKLKVDTCEYGDDGKGHTFQTMQTIQKAYPDHTIKFLIGDDKLNIIPRWGNAETFFQTFGFIVCCRTANDQATCKKRIADHPVLRRYADIFSIITIPDGLEIISSTAVRTAIQNGYENDLNVMLNPKVKQYIKEVHT